MAEEKSDKNGRPWTTNFLMIIGILAVVAVLYVFGEWLLWAIWQYHVTVGWLLVGYALIQALPDDWAGGKLFSRRFAWVTGSLATIVGFLLLIAPLITLEKALGLLVVVAVALLTIYAKREWAGGDSQQ